MSRSRYVILGAGLALVIPALALAVYKYRGQQQLFFPKPEPVRLTAATCGLNGARDVAFTAAGATLHGWYTPSTNGAAVILTHGAGGNRVALLPEAKTLLAHGFGVLLFDWPGHGESQGEIHWNEGERKSLRAAIDWLVAQPDVRGKLGAYGFSMGGYVVTQVAATDARLAAVVLAGTPAIQREQVHFQHGRFGLLGELPALYALKRGGMQVDERRPIDEIGKIAPRAVLVIGGSNDAIVPPAMAPALFERAGQPKELLVINGAGHGGYADVQGSTYLDKLSSFFQQALLGSGG